MEWTDVFLTILTGTFLRFAVPIGGTLLVVLWLRWLDVRWQREAEEYRKQVGEIKPIVHLLPCWKILGCEPERRKNCPAYLNGDAPCWQYFRTENGRLKEQCLSCRVFREAPIPVAA